MIFHYEHSNRQRASELRKNMTRQERRLWYGFLSAYAPRFRRQKRFGSYIVDFYCAAARLAIELDGSQHFNDGAMHYDGMRTACLESLGIVVLRITNIDVDERFDDVCAWIDDTVESRLLSGRE
jgi:very-short-patch-repair endonuclease